MDSLRFATTTLWCWFSSFSSRFDALRAQRKKYPTHAPINFNLESGDMGNLDTAASFIIELDARDTLWRLLFYASGSTESFDYYIRTGFGRGLTTRDARGKHEMEKKKCPPGS